jgi:hypothetical protein
MTRIVRIDQGSIVELFDVLPVLHPTLMRDIRTDAPDDVAQGWHFDGTDYAPPSGPDIAVLQRSKCTEIDAYRDQLLAAGMLFAGKFLQLDERSQQHIIAKGTLAKFALAGQGVWPADFAWIMADNSLLPLSAQGMDDLASAADSQVTRWRFTARAHKDAALALTDIASLADYDFKTGW